MQFQHTWQQVMDGSKTLTSRIVKPTEHLAHTFEYAYVWSVPTLRPKYQVGKTYAVQPGRTAKAIGRIELLAIRQYDVRDITAEEARREGFQTKGDFWFTWITMHDKRWLETYRYAHDCDYLDEYGFYQRPAERYTAWQLAFKLCAE